MKIRTDEVFEVDDIKGKLLERRALPIGRTQFEEWSDRIIQGAMIQADPKSLKFALASMLMHLGPTEAYKEDGWFILNLRKGAVNQTAHMMLQEMKEEQQKKTAEETAQKSGSPLGLLANEKI